MSEPTLEEQIEWFEREVGLTVAKDDRDPIVYRAILASLRRLAGREGEQVPRGVLLDAIEALRNACDAEANNARLWEREAKKLGWRP